ncbi:MAG TPA: VTT domain-containing protein [Phycisphaerae bacterium]|nr:VTT domain-containing protein [Phycisphaerae bacterium]
MGLALATLVSEDLACFTAGLWVAEGSLGFFSATAGCSAGILAGDLALVVLGRTLGRRAVAANPLRRWISPESVRRAEAWFERQGLRVVFASRFLPGTRLPTYLAAGVSRAPTIRLLAWFCLAVALWTPLLIGLAAISGASAQRFLAAWTGLVPALILAALLGWLLVRLATALGTWRGRRLLLGRWRRMTRWEFWPAWAIYPPVVCYIVWLGLRHRRLTLPTAVNPGIGNGGGLVGESKSAILRGLASAGDAVARWELIPPGPAAQRLGALRAFMHRERLELPIVLKPDVGERGAGVVIVRDELTLTSTLSESPEALIAQAYVGGVEYGVFYARRPGSRRGAILAITDKRWVEITGDGASTLEELILADDRAVCLAPFFLRRWAGRLEEIPARDEKIALSELGTHCRGALFLDGTALATPALTAEVERVSGSFDGFYFGRFDVRATSEAAFQRGEFTVIELNGLTSETTSIYDPRNSLWSAWGTLCRQWRLAFAIAADNRARGVRPLTLRETWRLRFPASPSRETSPLPVVIGRGGRLLEQRIQG